MMTSVFFLSYNMNCNLERYIG